MRRATIAQALAALALIAAAGPARAGDVPLRVAQSSVRAIDGVTVDVDASSLRDSSNLRLVVVSASTPDEVSDVQALYFASVGIHAGRVRLTLPGGPAGKDEVRLYHVPELASTYAIAAARLFSSLRTCQAPHSCAETSRARRRCSGPSSSTQNTAAHACSCRRSS